MLLRLMSKMATAQPSLVQRSTSVGRQSVPGKSKRGTTSKAPLPSLTTAAATADRPKSFSDATSLPGHRSGRTTATGLPSSANAVNQRRNVRQRKTLTTSQSDTSLNKKLQNLSISDKKRATSRATSSSSAPIRKSSSASSGTCKTLEDVARLILAKRCKNIVVMAGAGISTPSGIPDFRTPGSGLYDNLQQYKIPFPEAIFDIDFFQKDPRPFFTLAKELYPGGQYKPNYVHYFCRMLYEKGLLLRMYTQNIDGLERLAGIPANKLVEAHGTFLKASCTRCGHPHDGEHIKGLIFNDRIPSCSLRGCIGKVKPDIVFFGEDLPKRFFYYLKDLPQCDLVIIMGTSLEVYPFAGIVNSARGYIPRLLINRDLVGPFKKRPGSSSRGRFNDLGITGDLVECVQRFSRVLGWKKSMEDLIKEHEALLETNSEQILQGSSSDPSTNSIAMCGSPDSKPTNGSKVLDRKSPSNGSTANGSRNYHTVSEKTVTLNSNRTSPVRGSPSRNSGGGLALPKIGNDKGRNNNSWAVKVGRQHRGNAGPPSTSSSETESSSDDDTSSSSDDS